jgi:hypothetical protein
MIRLAMWAWMTVAVAAAPTTAADSGATDSGATDPAATDPAATAAGTDASATDPSATDERDMSDAGPTPGLHEPLPFSHDAHAPPFERAKLLCQDCHPIGLRQTEGGPAAPERVAPPLTTCHGCHLGEARRAPRAADSQCTNCHSDRSQLIPSSHGLGWDVAHGGEARAWRATCEDCHATPECVECHDQRGALTTSPHGPGFGSFHGVEARLDPASCGTCHAAPSCTECHTTGRTPW